MFNFFAKKSDRMGDFFKLSGGDFNHIKNVLRMKKGDSFLVSFDGASHLCEISEIAEDYILAKIIKENYISSELNIDVYLFQALPKSDKMELIIQKAVELGAFSIVPFESENCVVKLDGKKKESKTQRWQAISESAAKQSKRNIIPKIETPLSFKGAIEKAKELDLCFVAYENEKGMAATKEAFLKIKSGTSVGVFIGAEGGFTEKEIELLKDNGISPVSLGKRILRCETAAIGLMSAIMLYAETELSND